MASRPATPSAMRRYIATFSSLSCNRTQSTKKIDSAININKIKQHTVNHYIQMSTLKTLDTQGSKLQ